MKSFVKFIINIFLCHIFYRVKFINKEKEEKLDSCIICPNHSNTLEPTWIYSKTKNMYIMAKAELFENKILAKLYNYFNVFPIHRGEHDVRSLMHAINLFKVNTSNKLLIFPEGERVKKNMAHGVAKSGPIFIAAKVNVPIIPVFITRNVKLFSKVNVIYGDPIYIDKEVLKDKDKLNISTKDVLKKIYDLKI